MTQLDVNVVALLSPLQNCTETCGNVLFFQMENHVHQIFPDLILTEIKVRSPELYAIISSSCAVGFLCLNDTHSDSMAFTKGVRSLIQLSKRWLGCSKQRKDACPQSTEWGVGVGVAPGAPGGRRPAAPPRSLPIQLIFFFILTSANCLVLIFQE